MIWDWDLSCGELSRSEQSRGCPVAGKGRIVQHGENWDDWSMNTFSCPLPGMHAPDCNGTGTAAPRQRRP